jgi:glycosyltransferase involved in cell wall biosynthesis
MNGSDRPMFSVTLGSNRPGGIDIALAGLVGQTFKDFEVIFVDGLYHKRHAQVLDAVKTFGLKQPFFHVPNHRLSGTFWGTTCAGYNTGFMLAAGRYVVMLLDYAYAPPNWLAEHAKHQNAGPKICMGPHEYRHLSIFNPANSYLGVTSLDTTFQVKEWNRGLVDGMPPAVAVQEILGQKELFNMISIFGRDFEPGDLDHFHIEPGGDTKLDLPTGSLGFEYFNTKNESFPLEAIVEIGGMDENYDRGRGPGDPDIGRRLAMTGLPCWNVKEAIVHCLNPRSLMPNLNIVIENNRLPYPYHRRWNVADGNAYYDSQVRSGNKIAPNPFAFDKRQKDIWDWREQSQSRETLIPEIVIRDEDYFPDLKISGGKKVQNAPHLFDHVTQLDYIVWHKDPNLEKFIRHLIETVKPDRWVETGTHMGWTSMWIADNYPELPVYTVELDAGFYVKARENLAAWPQVSVTHSPSVGYLKGLVPMLSRGLTIFWLDAHWWPPVPLRQECKIVAGLEKYICLIDDFSCWDPDFSGDTFYGRAPNHGSCHLNDLYYVGPEMGYSCYRPSYEPQPGYKGVGLFMKGVDYVPPPDLMKWDTILLKDDES